MKLEIIDKSWALLLSRTLLPRIVNQVAAQEEEREC